MSGWMIYILIELVITVVIAVKGKKKKKAIIPRLKPWAFPP